MVLSYAASLACSWTWCIGMFLPVLLQRDFGPWSYIIFVIPNCLGAASMGLVLRREGASEHFLRDHAPMARLFSFVTLAFQWFFAAWLALPAWGGRTTSIALGALALGLLLATRWKNSSPGIRPGAIATLVASLVCLVWWLGAPQPGAGAPPPPTLPAHHLVPLALVCALGFGLCPYLDLTFHRVRRTLPRDAGNAAFVIGFLALFPLMTLMTFLYAPSLISESVRAAIPVAPGLLSLPLIVHLGLQLGYTIGVHTSELHAPRTTSRATSAGIGVLSLLAGAALAFIAMYCPRLAGHDTPELVYRVFMSFYGLVSPLYVLVFARHGARQSPRARALFWAALVLGAWFYWQGFVEMRTWWLAPGVATVIVAGLMARRQAAPAPAAPSA